MRRRVRLKPDTTISWAGISWVPILVGMALLSACSDGIGPTVVPPGTSGFTVFSGAGDIADCGLQGAEATARLLEGIPGTVFTLGDNAYPSGTLLDYARCYEPTWGRHLERTRAFYAKHGAKTIVIARFVPIIRTFAPVVAGAGRMPYRRFVFYNVAGGVGWVTSMTGAGYLLGQAIPDIGSRVHVVVLIVVILSVIPIVVEIVRERRRRSASS